MEHFTILEKICNNLPNSLEPGTTIYIFSAAIYDTWSNGTELEQNIAKKLITLWQSHLTITLTENYKKTKHHKNRPEYDNYCKKWIESKYKEYNDNKGIGCALKYLWESKYGSRVWI